MPSPSHQHLTPEVLTTETPLSNLERKELYRRKRWGWKLEDWWHALHPQDDGLVEDSIIGDVVDVPPYLRRQAE